MYTARSRMVISFHVAQSHKNGSSLTNIGYRLYYLFFHLRTRSVRLYSFSERPVEGCFCFKALSWLYVYTNAADHTRAPSNQFAVGTFATTRPPKFSPRRPFGSKAGPQCMESAQPTNIGSRPKTRRAGNLRCQETRSAVTRTAG